MAKFPFKQSIYGISSTCFVVLIAGVVFYNFENISNSILSLFPENEDIENEEEINSPLRRRLSNKEQGWGAIFGKKSTRKRLDGQYYIYAFSTPTTSNLETETLRQGKRKNYYCKWEQTEDHTCIIRKIIWDKTNMTLPINAKSFDKLINNDAISNVDLQQKYFNTFQIEVSKELFDKFNWLRTKQIQILSTSHKSFSTLTPIFGGDGPRISGRLNYFVGRARSFEEKDKDKNITAKSTIGSLKENTVCHIGKDFQETLKTNNWCTFYDLGTNAYGEGNKTKLVSIPNIQNKSTTLVEDSFYLIKTTQWFDIRKVDLSALIVDLKDKSDSDIKRVKFARVLPIFYLPNKEALHFKDDNLHYDNELPIVLLKD